MKNRFLNFLRKYWFCFLLSVIMVVGIFLTTVYADLYETRGGLDLEEAYLVLGLPLYSLIYGCLSYIKTKRIWIPQLVLCGISFLYWFRYGMGALFWEGTYIWSMYPVIFSLIGASITAFICYIIKSIKEYKI